MTIKSKHILQYILTAKDSDLLATLIAYKQALFIEQEEIELFELVEGIFATNHLIPDVALMKNYSMSKEARGLMKDIVPLKELNSNKSAQLAVNSLLYQNYIEHVSLEAKTGLQALAKADINNFQEATQDYMSDIQMALSLSVLKHTRESLIFGDEYVDKARARYAKAKMSGDYIVAKFGYTELDRQLGGIANIDFINIISYVKGFKSTLMRNVAYNVQMQAKNVLFITLEMSDEEVESEFLAMHASNKQRFGNGNPLIKSTAIREGTMDEEQEDFLFNTVTPDMANSDDMGILKVINPSEGDYFFSDLIADIDRTRVTMDIDVIVIDYLGMIKANNRNDRADVNEMFKSVRKYSLANKIPIINAVQAGRQAYNNMLEDEFHRYSADSASDYNEIERSSTMMISTAQTPEMKASGELLISCILARRANVDSMPFKAVIGANSRIVEVHASDDLEADTAEVLSQIDID